MVKPGPAGLFASPGDGPARSCPPPLHLFPARDSALARRHRRLFRQHLRGSPGADPRGARLPDPCRAARARADDAERPHAGELRGDAADLEAHPGDGLAPRSEEHTSELQSLMRISYAVFCLKKKKRHEYQHAHDETTKEPTE